MQRLYVITGCTASGKASLATALARRYGGQLLSVDSMKIYRGMTLGTAKPPPEVLAEIPHHAIDVADPWRGCSFTVDDYRRLADDAVAAIAGAGDVVIASGGTNLYLKVLLEGMFAGPGESKELRAALKARAAAEGVAALHAALDEVDPAAAERIHPNDERRIIRALEVYDLTGTPISDLQTQWDRRRPRYDYRMIILRRGREDGNRRINARVVRMIERGLVEEVRGLWSDPRGLNHQAAAALGYAEIIRHLEGEWPLDEAIERIKINTRRFAKNQRTWLKRFTDARYFDLEPDSTVEGVLDRAGELLELG
ncbi:MAG: tRNA (adenosine(37)-N6)-dimethylallyltransferase MiaA [Planctomycetota bacterium]